MIVGTTKEIKVGENRVGLTPKGAEALVNAGHEVLVETNAGKNSGFSDEDYKNSGASIVSADGVWKKSEIIVKVKEPIKSEYNFLRNDLILFTYLHLAADKELTNEMLKSEITGIAYETVELDNGDLPLLKPMSEVAGMLAVQKGAQYLERPHGKGKLIPAPEGLKPATVTIIGSGSVGIAACKVAAGMGANVVVIGRNEKQLDNIKNIFGVETMISTPENIAKAVAVSDLVIGGVAITGAKAPKLVTREMIKRMDPGSVVVDVSIDQGGCFETSRPTTHENPIYIEEGVIHYCVTNMPALVPYTSTIALTTATLPYVLKLANGLYSAIKDKPLARGVNTFNGKLTNIGVAEAFGMQYVPLEKLI